MATEDIRRAALAVLAVFAAHTFAVMLTEPLQPAVIRSSRHPVAMAAVAPRMKVRPVVHAPKKDPIRTVAEAKPKKLSIPLASGPDLTAYQGLGSWIDLFDRSPWRNPSWTVRRMAHRGVRTIYLQTATYGSSAPIVWPKKVGEFIASAHRRKMTVVGWSVPSFKTPEKDFWRARAGVNFRTGAGERFDSFALDIESDIVDNIWLRNHRLLDLTRKVRKVAGAGYTLGAIIPDTHSRYWPDFPYKEVAARYQVIVPMAYSTFQTHGYKGVRTYTASNIRTIRKETGNPKVAIHVIGGIADDVGVPAARGFIRAIKDNHALGASLYDFPITSEATWKELTALP
ncbi:MAG: hypothetical protein QOG04_1559 [Actinomycetota bacterium]|nr:hypothetical protein [Actinomycetota bacterium]